MKRSGIIDTRTYPWFFREKTLVRLWAGPRPVTGFMPLSAARGLRKALGDTYYTIRQPVENDRYGNSDRIVS